jgi:hypothetical protein
MWILACVYGVKINGFLMISKTRYIFMIAWFFEIDR